MIQPVHIKRFEDAEGAVREVVYSPLDHTLEIRDPDDPGRGEVIILDNHPELSGIVGKAGKWNQRMVIALLSDCGQVRTEAEQVAYHHAHLEDTMTSTR